MAFGVLQQICAGIASLCLKQDETNALLVQNNALMAELNGQFMMKPEDVQGCILMEAFDSQDSQNDPGDTSTYRISVNGGATQTIVHDHTTTQISPNKSTWYTPIVNAVNALNNWTMTVDTDADFTDNNDAKVRWRMDYSGPGNETLVLEKVNTNTFWNLTVDATGAIVGVATENGAVINNGQPVGSEMFFPCP